MHIQSAHKFHLNIVMEINIFDVHLEIYKKPVNSGKTGANEWATNLRNTQKYVSKCALKGNRNVDRNVHRNLHRKLHRNLH